MCTRQIDELYILCLLAHKPGAQGLAQLRTSQEMVVGSNLLIGTWHLLSFDY